MVHISPAPRFRSQLQIEALGMIQQDVGGSRGRSDSHKFRVGPVSDATLNAIYAYSLKLRT